MTISPLLDSPTHEDTQRSLTRELDAVEVRFAAELQSDLGCVNELVGHVERYRGKMLRPMLVLLPGLAIPPHELTEAHRVVATVVEMVHMATLVHDDILDEARTRRRGATVNALRGNETAVMLGDYLISHAYHLCSSLDLPWVASAIARTTNTVCAGELLQLSNRYNWELGEATYFQVIGRKTASLCSVSCMIAARLSGATPAQAAALERYGECLGVAFQIVDDLLDLTGHEQQVGKTLGLDLVKGKLTLPLIHHLANVTGVERAQSLALLQSQAPRDDSVDHRPDPEVVAAIIARLTQTDSLNHARRRAQALITTGVESLQAVPPSAPRDLLAVMAQAVSTRSM